MQPASAPSQPARPAPHPPGGYVFVVTYGRSGSTLLQNLLNGIDGYCIRGENENVLMHFVRGWHAVQNSKPMQGHRNSGRVSTPEEPWFGAENVDPARLGQSIAAMFAREVLRLPPDTRVGGFKEIRFTAQPDFLPVYLNFLHRFFPRTRIVFNLRAHDSVAKSGWWASMDPARVAEQLTRTEAAFQAYQDANPDRCLTLRYDDYIADHSRFEPLFRFLGESFDSALVERVMDRKLAHLQASKPS
jgi:hypothetical protein